MKYLPTQFSKISTTLILTSMFILGSTNTSLASNSAAETYGIIGGSFGTGALIHGGRRIFFPDTGGNNIDPDRSGFGQLDGAGEVNHRFQPMADDSEYGIEGAEGGGSDFVSDGEAALNDLTSLRKISNKGKTHKHGNEQHRHMVNSVDLHDSHHMHHDKKAHEDSKHTLKDSTHTDKKEKKHNHDHGTHSH